MAMPACPTSHEQHVPQGRLPAMAASPEGIPLPMSGILMGGRVDRAK